MAQAKISHPVTVRRAAQGWTQADLAIRADLPRSTVSAIENRQLTPSVTAALALARALDCSVEELFAGGEARPSRNGPQWAWQPKHEPVRYWEAAVGARRLLFPVEAPSANCIPHDGLWAGGIIKDSGAGLAETTLVMACCDPAAGLLAAEYARASGYRLVILQRGGEAAIDLLKSGLVHIAGIHRSTNAAPDRNSETVRTRAGGGYRLLRLADWEEGLAVTAGERSRSPASIARQCHHWALREPGSAARECLDELLRTESPSGRTVSGHLEVAEAVRAGWADAGVCVRLAAEQADLKFLPLRTESLDLCFAESQQHDPRIQALIRLVRSRSQRRLISELPGYDVRNAGEMAAV